MLIAHLAIERLSSYTWRWLSAQFLDKLAEFAKAIAIFRLKHLQD